MIGFSVSASVYALLTVSFNRKFHSTINNVFAAAAVSIYYIFRIPALLGFSLYNRDGMLVDLTGVIAGWLPFAITVCTTLFFFYWLVVRKPNKESWVVRPAFANRA
jgi:hypothetical protein